MARRSRREAPDETEYLPPEDEEMEEERPSRRRRRPRDEDEEEEEERPRRRAKTRDDDDDDDEPKRRRATSTAGWGGYEKTRKKTSNFAQKWKPPIDDEVLIKFLDDEPFGNYALHWFEELGKGQKKGFMCLETVDEACPACAVGDRPKGKALFRVVAYNDNGTPEPQVLEAGTWLAEQLHTLAGSKNGPLSKHYWSISGSGGKGKGPVTYSLSVVKEKDEEEWEDWDLKPLTDDELEEFAEVEHDLEDIEQIPKAKDLKAIVDSLED